MGGSKPAPLAAPRKSRKTPGFTLDDFFYTHKDLRKKENRCTNSFCKLDSCEQDPPQHQPQNFKSSSGNPRRLKPAPLTPATMLMPKKSQKKKRRARAARIRPRVRMSDAMRARGLDETKLATKLDGLLQSKSEKVRFEVVKECGKLLEVYPAPRTAASQDSMPVQLVTHVPRPAREEASGPSLDLSSRPEISFGEGENFEVKAPAQ